MKPARSQFQVCIHQPPYNFLPKQKFLLIVLKFIISAIISTAVIWVATQRNAVCPNNWLGRRPRELKS